MINIRAVRIWIFLQLEYSAETNYEHLSIKQMELRHSKHVLNRFFVAT